MVSGINSFYYAGIADSVTLSDRSRHTAQSVANSRPDDSRKVKVSDQGSSIRPFAPEADIKMSLSGSVIHEPKSLLADLSGVRRPQEMGREVPKTALPYRSSPRSGGFELIIDDPITSTFEIIV
jgi:hypothetical protein